MYLINHLFSLHYYGNTEQITERIYFVRKYRIKNIKEHLYVYMSKN
jgi:hypothetical protein